MDDHMKNKEHLTIGTYEEINTLNHAISLVCISTWFVYFQHTQNPLSFTFSTSIKNCFQQLQM